MAILNKTGITSGGTIQSEHITRTIDALTGVSTDTIIATGSFTGSLNGSLIGTASFATSASRSVSSSFATTASYALNAGGGSSFPFVGVAVITGSLIVSGSSNDVTTYTRNVTIDASNVAAIAAPNITITGDTQIDGQAASTNWQAAAPSILDWQRAGETSDNGQFVLPIQAPTSPKAGTIYMDTTSRNLFVFDGTDWREFVSI
jgi:hypothetical protein